MFDIGWTESALIAVVAILVIGPKELPVVLRTVGKYIGKARRMAREFQDGLEQVARDAELEEAANAVKKAGDFKNSLNPGNLKEGVKDAIMKDFPDIENDDAMEKEKARLDGEASVAEHHGQADDEPPKPGEEPAWLKEYMANAKARADAQEPVLAENGSDSEKSEEPAITEDAVVTDNPAPVLNEKPGASAGEKSS